MNSRRGLMGSYPRLGRGLILWTLILVMGAGSIGCKKMRADWKRKRFNKVKEKAEQYYPFTNVPSEAEQAEKMFTDGVTAFQRQQFDEALRTLTNAVNQEKQVLEQARMAQAQKMFTTAQQELQIANNNAARQVDVELFARIEENANNAQEARTDQKWDRVIEYSQQVVDLVNQILTPLRNDASTAIKQAKSQRESLLEEGAENYAPDFVQRVDRLIEEAESEFDPTRNFRDAKLRADEAFAQASDGITETQKQISAEKIQQIQTLLTEAGTLNSREWVPDTYEQVQDQWANLIDAHDTQQDYLRARDISNTLIPNIENMILTTRRLRAQSALNEFGTQLAQIIAEEARRYLPDEIAQLESTRDEATRLFEETSYTQVEDMSNKGMTTIQTVREAYDSFTSSEIRKARTDYDIANEVFQRMQHIFIIKPSEFIKKIDLEFENNKEALRTELETKLKKADESLNQAENLRAQEKRFHDAIQMAREQSNLCVSVLSDTYHVAAHNAINEVADQLSRWKGDGGDEWAAEQVAQTEMAISNAIELLGLQQVKEAISQAAEARWQLDFAIQLIKEKAVAELQTANQLIKDAENQQAQRYQAESLSQAHNLYKQAQQFLQNEKLKQSILTAMETQRVASLAMEQARLMWTRDQIEQAVTEVRQAEEAGSAFYAETRLDKAQDLLATARKLFDTEQYDTARLSASQAIEEALSARFFKINQADDIIDTVRRYGGWKYDNQRLSEAIILAKQAREQMEAGSYQQANLTADEAGSLASSVLNLSKVKAFSEQLATIKQTLNDVLNSGAKFYLTSNVRQMLREIEQIEQTFTLENYDEVIVQANRINKDLSTMLQATPDIVAQTITEKRQEISTIEERDDAFTMRSDLNNAKRYLTSAELEFQKQRYSSSYTYLRRANSVLSRLQGNFVRDAYLEEVRQIMDDYIKANDDFSQILTLDPRVLMSFTRDSEGKSQYVAIAGGLSPFQYRSSVDQLYDRTIKLQPPTDMQLVHRELVWIMEKTRQAAINFEQLQVLDQFDQERIKSVIDRAYALIDQARGRQQKLSEHLLHEGTSTQKI